MSLPLHFALTLFSEAISGAFQDNINPFLFLCQQEDSEFKSNLEVTSSN